MLRGEDGYLMAGLMAAVTILLIFSTLAFQAWIDVLRRDNEAEMIFRAQDLVRAIQRYRRDHGGVGPMKLADLMEPGPRSQYYLRQLWKDPLVRDGKWGLLYAGPNGQVVDPNAEQPVEGSLFGDNPPGSGFGNRRSGPGPAGSGTQPGAQPGQTGAGPSGSGTPGSSFGNFGGSAPGEDENAGGRQQSGLPIAGVKSLCKDKPFRVYNGLTEYAQWLFTYFDLEQQQTGLSRPAGPGPRGRAGFGGTPGGAGSTPGGPGATPGAGPGGTTPRTFGKTPRTQRRQGR